MLIPSSDPLLKGRQLIISATAGHIPALKVPPSYIAVTADRGVRERVQETGPLMHVFMSKQTCCQDLAFLKLLHTNSLKGLIL